MSGLRDALAEALRRKLPEVAYRGSWHSDRRDMVPMGWSEDDACDRLADKLLSDTALVAALRATDVPSEPDANPWLERLVKVERENHCGDAACMTRRVSAAIRVLTGGKEHQDYCWAIEVFEVELGIRDPETVGAEPSVAKVEVRPDHIAALPYLAATPTPAPAEDELLPEEE